MSQESADLDPQTEEVLTYTVQTVDYPCNDTSTEGNIQPRKPKKRKVNTKTVKMQRDNDCPPLKTCVYRKSYYRQQVRSLFTFMNQTCKLETRVLSSCDADLTTNEQNEENCSLYFTVLGRRFQTLASLQ